MNRQAGVLQAQQAVTQAEQALADARAARDAQPAKSAQAVADAEEALYRAAQEGLTNVRKHAGATGARLLLDRRDAAVAGLEVRDDGRGAEGDAAATLGYGLLGLRERAERLAGRLTVDTAPGRGLTLRVEVPVGAVDGPVPEEVRSG